MFPTAGLGGERTRTGSVPTILADLADQWIEAFEATHDGADLQLPPPHGPPQGRLSIRLREFLGAARDFAFMTRDLRDEDRARFREHHGAEPRPIAVASGSFDRFGYVDAIALIVNRRNPLRRLSFEQIDALYSATRLRGLRPILTWSDLGLEGSEWNHAPLRLLGGGEPGTEDSAKAAFIRRRVLSTEGRAGAWRADIGQGRSGEDAVPFAVANDIGAIGITAMGHLVPGVRPLAIAESMGGPAVDPTLETVRNGRYPLARPIELILSARALQDCDTRLIDFARFLLSSEGQEIVRREGSFLPLPETKLRESRETLSILVQASRCAPQVVRWEARR